MMKTTIYWPTRQDEKAIKLFQVYSTDLMIDLRNGKVSNLKYSEREETVERTIHEKWGDSQDIREMIVGTFEYEVVPRHLQGTSLRQREEGLL
jgi:hypothetical protein